MHMYQVWDKNDYSVGGFVVARNEQQALLVVCAHIPNIEFGISLAATHIRHEPFQRIIGNSADVADILLYRSTWSMVRQEVQKTYRKRFTK